MKIDPRFVEPIDHNSLSDLQGGAENEYYHLDEQAYDNVMYFSEAVDDILEGRIPIEHNDLLEVQGGAVDDDGKTMEAYHLTALEFSQVQFLLENYDELVALLDS